MIPTRTTYRLAKSPADYRRCRALQTTPDTLSFPTVMAERDGAVIGFLATQPRRDLLVAGPLVTTLTGQAAAILIMRLIDAYEAVLRQAGVTLYLFSVERTNTAWLAKVAALGATPYEQGDTLVWFKREVA